MTDQKPRYYQIIHKREGLYPELTNALSHSILTRFILSGGATFLICLVIAKRYGIQSLPLLFTAIIALLTLAIVACKELRTINNPRRLTNRIQKLDWYVGENSRFLILLVLDEYPDIKKKIKYVPDIDWGPLQEEYPHSPFLADVRLHESRIKDRTTRCLYRLAVCEIIQKQKSIHNHAFFQRPDFWEYYTDYSSFDH